MARPVVLVESVGTNPEGAPRLSQEGLLLVVASGEDDNLMGEGSGRGVLFGYRAHDAGRGLSIEVASADPEGRHRQDSHLPFGRLTEAVSEGSGDTPLRDGFLARTDHDMDQEGGGQASARSDHRAPHGKIPKGPKSGQNIAPRLSPQTLPYGCTWFEVRSDRPHHGVGPCLRLVRPQNADHRSVSSFAFLYMTPASRLRFFLS